MPIEMAQMAKDNGNKVIAITSMEQSKKYPVRIEGQKKLFEIADLVLDNCVPPGDGMLEIGGELTGAASTISGCFIVNLIATEAMKMAVYQGVKIPVYFSQNIDGFEIELSGRISDQLQLSMSYADYDGETTSQNKEIPEYTFTAFANYQVNDDFGIGFGVTSSGDTQIGSSAAPYLPSYTRVDVAAYYKIADDLTVQMNIENLTDETYFPHSHSTHQASVGEEVNANFSIRRTF